MLIAGVDYSMMCPAICVYDTTTSLDIGNLKFYCLHSTKQLKGVYGNITIDTLPKEFGSNEERFSFIREWAMDVLSRANMVEHVVIEDYAMNARGTVFHIGENTGQLKMALYERNIPFTTVSPTHVKMIFSGKGNASKPDMIDAFSRKFARDLADIVGYSDKKYKAPFTDMCDACAIMTMFLEE